MIFLPDMHHFVNDHVINSLRRRHDQAKSEGQMILFRAGSPTFFGGGDSKAAGRQPKPLFVEIHPPGEVGPCLLPVPGRQVMFSHLTVGGAVQKKAVAPKYHSRIFQRVKKSFQEAGLSQVIKSFARFIGFLRMRGLQRCLPAQGFFNPGLFFFDKAPNLCGRRMNRRLNGNFRLIADLQRDGFFSFWASYQRVLNIHGFYGAKR
ncbi:MAG TPA: hypothetical protein P5208_05825 [Smithellaceae bacterium]|nr:hypothetical protein [Smithellaceae bacterium]HRV44805.1 hypothetical protein [Smithellaceae bacterium]